MTRETNENTPVANRKFKDTIFRMLFSEKEALLSLYNAVNDSNYTDADATGNCNFRKCYLHGNEE